MGNPITSTQERYLYALLQNLDRNRFEELKKELKVTQDMAISELTKDEAYRLISKIIAESSGEVVQQALAAALEKETA